MSKAFIASVLQDAAGLPGTLANAAASDVISAIVTRRVREGSNGSTALTSTRGQ